MFNNPASSIGDALNAAAHQTEIEARQSSYAIATEIVKNVVTRYGPPDAKGVAAVWTEVADLTYLKIKLDMDKIFSQK